MLLCAVLLFMPNVNIQNCIRRNISNKDNNANNHQPEHQTEIIF